jgi:hypothetical protein
VLGRVSPAHLALLRQGRAFARSAAWAEGAGSDLKEGLCSKVYATMVIADPDKQTAEPTMTASRRSRSDRTLADGRRPAPGSP